MAAVAEVANVAIPENHWLGLMAQCFHGVCLFKLERLEESEAKLIASLEALRETLGEQHPKTDERANTASLYEAWGMPERAAQYRETIPTDGETGYEPPVPCAAFQVWARFVEP